ncbi:hypothetical protein [Nocardioides massiliensis]|uniref:Tetratricopeptide repeat protein n=1 Tax=Nocardioides massiliensis TaxID=1325935 RepID=A0ABT9NMA7_9ACTN|nr:hypothetical protein [Nocardioides massiliensis]MDP9821556.1 hypothetical protein [Nocardioides massiliensis]
MRLLGNEPYEALRRAESVALSDPIGALPLAAAAEQALAGTHHEDVVGRLALLRARAHTVRGEHFPALAQIRLAHREWIAEGHPERGTLAQLAAHEPFLALSEFDMVVDSARRIFSEMASADLGPDGDQQLISWHAEAHLAIGRAFDGKGETRPAMRHFDVAANLFQVLGDPTGVAQTHAARGHTLLTLNMAHRAVEELLAAYKHFHSARLELPAHRTLVHLGRALLSQGRVSAAISLLQRTRIQLVLLGARGDVAESSWR